MQRILTGEQYWNGGRPNPLRATIEEVVALSGVENVKGGKVGFYIDSDRDGYIVLAIVDSSTWTGRKDA